jgi:hypothetical protein
MNIKDIFIKYEKGQMIPWVVLLSFVILGVVALIVDGGALFSNRRTAQAAADAGALAGAKRACTGYADAIPVAEAYALNNGASGVSVTQIGKEITVTATVENVSFFGRIFGQENLTTSARATAGCYGPKGKSAVPLAWYCRAPSVGEGPFRADFGCEMQTLDWNLVDQLRNGDESTTVQISDFDGNVKTYSMIDSNILDIDNRPPEQIYIVVDSDKVCVEDGGEIPCDLDGDGKKDIQLGGDRGWLYLTADTSSIGDWVDDGPHPNITIDSHVWLSGKPGVATSVYIKMINSGFIGQVVLVPVYNVICDGDPRVDTACVEAAHDPDQWPAFDGTDNFDEIRNTQVNYHILTFQPFYISCIDTMGNCPGFTIAQSLPGGDALTDGPVIEGFFLSNMTISPDDKDGCAINLGNCQISLSE